MCTVTFIPREEGFYVAMNRDERNARPRAISPAVFEQGSAKSIYPLDSEGGTWIAANDRGIALTLLNWNDAPLLCKKRRTRGLVIPGLVTSDCSRAADAALLRLDLEGILPFRLVGIFPSEERVIEWLWDQRSVKRNTFTWTIRQWCSSSLSDAAANSFRKRALEDRLTERDAGSLPWLRRLHSSHDHDHPLFSHCVHRKDVETVSYTELVCSAETIECNYLAGGPCNAEVNRTAFRSGVIRLRLKCNQWKLRDQASPIFG